MMSFYKKSTAHQNQKHCAGKKRIKFTNKFHANSELRKMKQ